MEMAASEAVTEPCRVRRAVEISRGNTEMKTRTEERRTLLAAVQEMASEMTATGSRKIPMAMTTIPVRRDKVLVAIDTARVDTSTKCRGRTRAETSQAVAVAVIRAEVVEGAEIPDAVIIRTMAVAEMEEVAPGRMIVAVAAAAAVKVEVEATGMVLLHTRVSMTMVPALVVTMGLATLVLEAPAPAVETLL